MKKEIPCKNAEMAVEAKYKRSDCATDTGG